MKIIARAEWGARPPASPPIPIEVPTPRLWLHHSADDAHGPAAVRAHQAYHMDSLGWNDVGYSFLVDDADQTVYEGRGGGVQGAHTYNDNSGSHGICVLGNFDARPPNGATIRAVADLVRHGHEQGWWPETLTGGHCNAPDNATVCPGRFLVAVLGDINRLALGATPPPVPPAPPPGHHQIAVIIAGTVDHQIVQRHLGRFALPVVLPDHPDVVVEAIVVGAAVKSERLDLYRYLHWVTLGGAGAPATDELLLHIRQRLDQKRVKELRWVGHLF